MLGAVGVTDNLFLASSAASAAQSLRRMKIEFGVEIATRPATS
jgi:hypothetical protein